MRCDSEEEIVEEVIEAVTASRVIPGGYSVEEEADDDIQSILDLAMSQEDPAEINLTDCAALSYKYKVVAGTDYWIKAKCQGHVQDKDHRDDKEDKCCVHMAIHVPLPSNGQPAEPKLTGMIFESEDAELPSE